MTCCYRVFLRTALALGIALPAVSASAQETAEMEQMKSEMKEIKSMLQNIDGQLKKVLTELAAVKRGQAAAGQRPSRQPDTTVYDVKVGDSPVLGPADAPVTIVEFSEFQCPFCIREDPKIKQILKEYPDDVKVVFKHYPLSFHKKAKPAAAATVLAQKEKGNDGFWQMHDMIVAGGTKKLEVSDLRGYAEKIGLNLEAFDALMKDTAKQDELLKADMEEARKCKVRGTPTVLINGLKLADRSLNGYKARIDEILKKQKAKAGTN